MASFDKMKQNNEERKQREFSDLRAQTGSVLPAQGSEESVKGQITGEGVARRLFGTGADDIGAINKRVVSEREAALNQTDPVSTRIKQSANVQTRAARAAAQSQGRDLSSGEQAQIQRSAESDISDQLYQNKQSALNAYARTGSSLSSNTLSTIMGYGGLSNASTNINVPTSGGVTVICTELHRQGYLSDEIMEKDHSFGISLRENAYHVYLGYMIWAPYVVSMMQKSKVFTYVVSIFGKRWAKDMAGEKSFTGSIINKIGMPICGTLGRIKLWLTSTKYLKI